MFKIEFSNQASRFLRKCEDNLVLRILDKLEFLKNNPIPSDAKFIGRDNNEKILRIRIGKFRVLYKLKNSEKVILITRIDKRNKVYD